MLWLNQNSAIYNKYIIYWQVTHNPKKLINHDDVLAFMVLQIYLSNMYTTSNVSTAIKPPKTISFLDRWTNYFVDYMKFYEDVTYTES